MPIRRSLIQFLVLVGSLWLLICPVSYGQAELPSDRDVALATRLFRALDVEFEPGRATIHPSSMNALDAAAAALQRFPDLRLEIAGYTDALGSASTNLRLSEQRAQAVKDYLVDRHGIDPLRLRAVGFGEENPIASNATAAGRALNRRVEFNIIRTEPVVQERQRIDVDSLREAIRRQVEEAVRAAIPEPDTTMSEEERLLRQRLDELERLLAEQEDEVIENEGPPEVELARVPPAARGTGLLPFTGFYFRSDFPVLLGIRGDFPTTIIGTPRFQPEAALAFRPDDRATLFGANLVYTIPHRLRPDITPFLGAGIGFHNLDGFESVLNVLIGAEYQLGFGILFADFMTQDFFDFNRVVIGFRQEF